MRDDVRDANTARHQVRVVASLIPGVYSTETRSARRFGKHWHDVFGFGLLQDGAQSSASGRGQVEAFPGDIICTNPGEVHDGRPLGADTRKWRIVSVDAATMSALIDMPIGRFEIARPVIHDTALGCALERIFALFEDQASTSLCDSTRTLAWEEALTYACALLISRHGNHPIHDAAPPAELRSMRERLLDARHGAPSLDELAVLTGLSRYQALRQFAREYGLTPHAWLLQHRAEEARFLIRAGRTLADAAAIAGFADQSHMTRVFVRHFGYTPGVWRRAMAVQ